MIILIPQYYTMLLQFDTNKHLKVYHLKYGTSLIIDRANSENFMNADNNEVFTCYRLGEHNWIFKLKAYAFPKGELSLKPVNSRNRIQIK